jgi:anti-anti-sigma factor
MSETAGETPLPEFWIDEGSDDVGRPRLGLVGELDMAGADRLHERLRALAQRGEPVLLDLRRLQFIDSTGLGELARAVTEARRDKWSLELDGALSPQVRNAIDMLELGDLFWPPA